MSDLQCIDLFGPDTRRNFSTLAHAIYSTTDSPDTWASIVDTIEMKWDDNHSARHELVNDIATLYRAMADSYEAFVTYCKTYGADKKSCEDWNRCVQDLTDVVSRLDPTLDIFAPEVQPVIRLYAIFESAGVQAAFVHKSTLERNMFTHEPAVILHFYSEAYKRAKAALRAFIEERFTIEEIHMALGQ